jgi:hypothetical protein
LFLMRVVYESARPDAAPPSGAPPNAVGGL